jgi:hypothetical protein
MNGNANETNTQSYQIEITETLQMQVSVEANSPDEALDMVKVSYKNSDYVLDAEHFTGVNFSIVGVQHKKPCICELAKAVRKNDNYTLHIIKRDVITSTPFVVCWNLITDSEGKHIWDWGTYCNSYDEAREIFKVKCLEHDFIEYRR